MIASDDRRSGFGDARCQSACKPGSGWPEDRSPDVTAIPLGRALLRASSNQPGRQGPETGPSPLARRASSLFGFAPGGACHAVPVAGSAVRSYRTFSPLPADGSRNLRPQAVRSLWRFPWGRPRRTLSGTVFPWSPDFPPSQARAAVRPTGARASARSQRQRQGAGAGKTDQLLAVIVRTLAQ